MIPKGKMIIKKITQNINLKMLRAIFLRRKILPNKFLREYDNKVKIHLGKENDFYLFENVQKPHKRILMNYYCFMRLVTPPYTGRNLLEIGAGAGGFSFIAQKFGFDVISTDNGGGIYEKAGEVSRETLNIKSIKYEVSYKNSVSEILKFTNNMKVDYIIIVGVPFNRETINSKVVWYDADKWVKVLIDFWRNLNPNGILFDIGVYKLDKILAEQIENRFLVALNGAAQIDFNFDNFNPIKNEYLTNIKMTRL